MSQADLTQTFNPEKFWPKADACPDWPLSIGSIVSHGAGSKQAAEKRLSYINNYLHQGVELHAPTAKEVEQIKSDYFSQGNHGQHWLALGVYGLTVRPGTRDMADLIVEALHIRGYLRKLEDRERRNQQSIDDENTYRNRQTVESYKRSVPECERQLAELADAEARHKQRLEDEKAFNKAADIRQSLKFSKSEAERAAHALGETLTADPVQ